MSMKGLLIDLVPIDDKTVKIKNNQIKEYSLNINIISN